MPQIFPNGITLELLIILSSVSETPRKKITAGTSPEHVHVISSEILPGSPNELVQGVFMKFLQNCLQRILYGSSKNSGIISHVEDFTYGLFRGLVISCFIVLERPKYFK